MINISILYSREIKELFVHGDHLFHLGIKYNLSTIVLINIDSFISTVQQILNWRGFSFGGVGHIGMLQATQMTQEVTIKDLESEKSRANERLSQLEEERAFLQSKTQSLDEEQKQQILELEKVKMDGGSLPFQERRGRKVRFSSFQSIT